MKFLVVAFVLVVASVTADGNLFHRELVVPVKTEGRITNGEGASPGEFPHQVGLSLKMGFMSNAWCGGALISSTRVLTAAHCTDGVKTVIVFLGATERTVPQQKYTVDQSAIIIHPEWNSKTVKNDISIIKIPAVTFTALIQPIRLPAISTSYSTYAGDSVIASGWGRTSDSASGVTNKLQWAPMTAITNSACARIYGSIVTPSNLCVSTPSKVSTCNGDSGGPLVNEIKELIGLTSFGAQAGCEMGFPAVFTRLTSYLPWIQVHTGVSY